MRTLEKLRREKQAVTERFEERIEKIKIEKQEIIGQAERLIAELDSQTDLLKSIREAGYQSENIKEVLETLKEINTHMRTSNKALKNLNYTETCGKDLAEIVEKALNEDLVQKTVMLNKPVGK